MFVTPLNTRRKEVLQAIVEAYIETATPVSSQSIAKRLRPRLSAATVRNEMAGLVELGLIWQPHTSAGRVPTDEGYRYYIDSLLAVEQLSEQEKRLIESNCLRQGEAFEQVLTGILRMLSNFSGYTAMAFSSGVKRILLKRMELVALYTRSILVVLISQTGLVKTAIIRVPNQIEQQELNKIARLLNTELSQLTLDEIKQRLALRLLVTQDVVFGLIKKALQILELSSAHFSEDKLYLEGTSCILGQPEFQNTHTLQAIFRTFEQQTPLLELMKEDLSPDGIKVHIGRENSYSDIQQCSMVVSNFKIKKSSMGSLGIIGPSRMPYAKIISAVSFMAQILDRKTEDFSG